MFRPENNSRQRLQLTPRETEVLKWTACGKTSGEIAKVLDISEDTVNAHIRNACVKLDAVNRTHATVIALIHGVIPIGPSPDLVIPLPTVFGLSRHFAEQHRESASQIARRSTAKKHHG